MDDLQTEVGLSPTIFESTCLINNFLINVFFMLRINSFIEQFTLINFFLFLFHLNSFCKFIEYNIATFNHTGCFLIIETIALFLSTITQKMHFLALRAN